jgi:hypothetical protein
VGVAVAGNLIKGALEGPANCVDPTGKLAT